jgi:hypothetical protein
MTLSKPASKEDILKLASELAERASPDVAAT